MSMFWPVVAGAGLGMVLGWLAALLILFMDSGSNQALVGGAIFGFIVGLLLALFIGWGNVL